MAYEKFLSFLTRLHQMTKEGRLRWEETVTEGVYQTAFPGYTVKIRTRPGSGGFDSEPDVVVTIYDEENTLIEEVSDVEVGDYWGDKPRAYRLMDDLYSSARRIAKGVEQALDTILEALEGADQTEESTKPELDDDDIPF